MSVLAVALRGADRVQAGTSVRLDLLLRIQEPLDAGASLRLSVPLGWTPPTLEGGPGLARWEVAGHATILGEIFRRRHVQLNLTGGRLRPGDTVLFTYGAGAEGTRAQPWVVDGPAVFTVEVSRDGDGAYQPDCTVPLVVEPNAPAYLHVVVPSGTRPGVEIPLRLRILDEFGNLCTSCTTEAVIGGKRAVPIEGGCGETGISFPHGGVYRVEASVTGLGLSGRSNPCRVSTDASVPLWGDPHVHTSLSDGVASPEFALCYARDVACLDFVAITDHDVEYHHAWFVLRRQRLSDDAWRLLGEIIGQHRAPGRFAALRAYEWTGRPYGDRCVYFRSECGALCRYEHGDAPTLEALWHALKRAGPGEALVVPHTSASGFMGTDWSEHDDDLETAVEVYSMHGSSECAGGPVEMAGAVRGRHVQDALARGYRFGFVAGGDMHSSQPGNPVLAFGPYRTLRFKPGLTAVFADQVDERTIFDAIRDRRTYATTGARMLLWFSVNGVPLGGELTVVSGQPVVVDGRLHGTSALTEVAIIRDGLAVYVSRPRREDFEFCWEDPHPPRCGATSYYYLRAVQEDGEVAWASPVWVDCA